MCVVRQINHIPTLEAVGYPEGNLKRWLTRTGKILDKLVADGIKIYGAGYLITAGGVTGPKHRYTIDHVLGGLVDNPPEISKSLDVSLTNRCPKQYSLQEIQDQLIPYTGFGPFIAYEVGTDLRWTRYYDGSDFMTWANPGPGAKRGLGRIFFGDKNARISKPDQLRLMQEMLATQDERRPSNVPKMELRDIEHCLCETDKYIRALSGDGRPKQRYRYEV